MLARPLIASVAIAISVILIGHCAHDGMLAGRWREVVD